MEDRVMRKEIVALIASLSLFSAVPQCHAAGGNWGDGSAGGTNSLPVVSLLIALMSVSPKLII
jgi:hypothetical protein